MLENVINNKSCVLPYSQLSVGLFKKIHSIDNEGLDLLFILIHYIFKFEYIVIYSFIIWIIILCKIKRLKENEINDKLLNYLNFAIILFIAAVVSSLTIILIKNLLSCPRPMYYLGADFRIKNNLYQNIRAWDSSLPSGHVALIAIILFASWPYISNILKLFGSGLLIVVSISRISLGLHFPHDVFASIIISFMLCYLSHWIVSLKKVQDFLNKIKLRIIVPYLVNRRSH